MPRVETIKASEAPQPPKKLSKAASEIVNGLQSLKKDEVLRLTPDEGKSVRGIKTSIGRIASTHGFKVESWDDGQAVYVKKTDK